MSDMFSEAMCKAGVTYPQGFKAAGVKAGIKKSGNLDLAVIYTEKEAKVAVAFLKYRTSVLSSSAEYMACREGYWSSMCFFASTRSSRISSPATRTQVPSAKAQISAFGLACSCFDTALTLPVWIYSLP